MADSSKVARKKKKGGKSKGKRDGAGNSKQRRKKTPPAPHSWLTVNGWAPRHIFDYNNHPRKCPRCGKKNQFLVDMYNMKTLPGDEDFVCAACCIKDYSPPSHLLLDSLQYLSTEGMYGTKTTVLEEEYIFTVETTPHLLRIIDIFRWFFTFSPFEASGTVVQVSVIPLKPTKYPLRTDARYFIQVVAGSWDPEFYSGVTLFAKDIVFKPPVNKIVRKPLF